MLTGRFLTFLWFIDSLFLLSGPHIRRLRLHSVQVLTIASRTSFCSLLPLLVPALLLIYPLLAASSCSNCLNLHSVTASGPSCVHSRSMLGRNHMSSYVISASNLYDRAIVCM
ncbi:hypothetical protein C8J56DRAFT_1027455 [Mycena floridula]|nr:hypothetical protein C8J56DRAFT_1027455 [Mycena floridula]